MVVGEMSDGGGIAIVGIGCRFPGASGPGGLRRLRRGRVR